MTTPKITIIAIVASNGAIGKCGDQPFHISADFKHFKSLTLGHPIIMGRRTFEALPKGALPGRRNIVVTRNKDWSAPDTETADSIEAAIKLCSDANEVMIIGGGQIYEAAMPMANCLEITHVHANVPDADTYFPAIEPNRWQKLRSSELMTDSATGITFQFVTYGVK